MLLTPTETPKRPSAIARMSSPMLNSHKPLNPLSPLASPSPLRAQAPSPLLRSISASASKSSLPSKDVAEAQSFATTLLSITTPALRIVYDFTVSIQYALTIVLSFLLANGLLAANHFLINLKYTLIFLGLRTYYLSQLIATAAYYITKEACIRGAKTSVVVTKEAYRRSEPARQRIFFEFMLLLFHPAPMIMLIFWPGWVIVGAVYVWWAYC